MRKVGIGVIGCGVISTAYLNASKQFPNIESARGGRHAHDGRGSAGAANSACPACGSTSC